MAEATAGAYGSQEAQEAAARLKRRRRNRAQRRYRLKAGPNRYGLNPPSDSDLSISPSEDYDAQDYDEPRSTQVTTRTEPTGPTRNQNSARMLSPQGGSSPAALERHEADHELQPGTTQDKLAQALDEVRSHGRGTFANDFRFDPDLDTSFSEPVGTTQAPSDQDGSDGDGSDDDGAIIVNHARHGQPDEEPESSDPGSSNSSADEDGPEDAWAKNLCEGYFLLTEKLKVSKTASRKILKYFSEAYAEVGNPILPSFATTRRHKFADLPPIFMDIKVDDQEKERAVFHINCETYPRKLLSDPTKHRLRHIITRMHARDIRNFHLALDDSHQADEAIISQDGVPLDGSSGRSYDITCLQFLGCKNIYVLHAFLPGPNETLGKCLSLTGYAGPIVKELNDAGIRVCLLIADHPKRAYLMGVKQSGFFGCEFCLTPGKSVQQRPGTKGKVVYPYTEQVAPRRAQQDFENVPRSAEQLQAAGATVKDLQGFKERSPLLDLAGFDIPDCVPYDIMHQLDLGVVRRLTELTFLVTETGKRRPEAKNYSIAPFNDAVRQIKVPTEVKRRPREMKFAAYKASEWRLLIQAFCPIILDCLVDYTAEKRLWALLFVTARALLLPRAHFPTALDLAEEKMHRFCHAFQNTFHKTNETYNVHSLLHSVETARMHGPLDRTSAYRFESVYARYKDSHAANNQSVMKSIIQANLLFYSRRPHTCNRRLDFTNLKTTSRRDDTLVYTEQGQWLRLLKKDGDGDGGTFLAAAIQVSSYSCKQAAVEDQEWAAVGVWRLLGISKNASSRVRARHVVGKGVIVPLADDGHAIILLTPEVLLDS